MPTIPEAPHKGVRTRRARSTPLPGVPCTGIKRVERLCNVSDFEMIDGLQTVTSTASVYLSW